MLNLLIGGIIGISIAAVVQGYTNGGESSHIQTITNIVIAIATVAAVFLTREQHLFQRRSRLWEANKEPLLDLSKTISDALWTNALLTEESFESLNNIPISNPVDHSQTKIFGQLENKLRHALEAYEPLLAGELLSSIKHYLDSQKEIDRRLTDGEINLFEAYDNSSAPLNSLLNAVNKQIKNYATT